MNKKRRELEKYGDEMEKKMTEGSLINRQKLRSWLRNPYNIAFIILLVLSIGYRWHFYDLTKNQPLWWDESSYMAVAKSYAGIGHYELESIRLPGFPLSMSLFFILGITNEATIRFFGLFLPSIILLIVTFIMFSVMYEDKRIALISVSILAVLWEHVFYSNRFHTENAALIFQFLAIIFLMFSYIGRKEILGIKPKYSLLLVGIFAAISVVYRTGNVLFIPGLIIFVVLLKVGPRLKNKNPLYLLGLIIVLIALGYFFLEIFSSNPLISIYYHPDDPIGWINFTMFYGMYQSLTSSIPSVFFYAFLIGITLLAYELYIYFPELMDLNNTKKKSLKSDVLNLLIILSVLLTFVFLIRASEYEYRWFFPLLPGLLAFTSKGITTVADYSKKVIGDKRAGVAILILLVFLGVYTQFARTEPLVVSKVNSYGPVKEAGLWLLTNSNPDDQILSISLPQISYYSERKTISYGGMTEEEFEGYIEQNNPEYLIVSIFEVNPPWLVEWLERNSQKLIVRQAYFADVQQQQALLIIYGFQNQNDEPMVNAQ